MPLSTQRDSVRAYLPLLYLKLSNDEPVYRVSSKSRIPYCYILYVPIVIFCIFYCKECPICDMYFGDFGPPYPEDLGWVLFTPTVLRAV
ncbi:hypothetical protein AVEN_253872-1 [Araneus ventricosus]|uniref:Uncharacterized protein n=1 Tax=Araneus ventricosus TaxID=182803 RepID=A0A4Y2SPE2_ARAVE|nr:hypothetical protein AVEN_253872-1 [Araneus ventricosus]